MKGFFANLFGSRQPDRVEYCLVDVTNDATKRMSMQTSVCLIPRIMDGRRLVFFMDESLRNNPLGRLRDSISPEDGEKLLIISISRLHVHNELPISLSFDICNPFDKDDATDAIRAKIKNATTATTAATTNLRPAPRQVYSSVATSSSGSYRLEVDEPPMEPLLMTEAEEDAREPSPPPPTTTIRGKRLYANQAEQRNVIPIHSIDHSSTLVETKEIYRASISEDAVKWFAGQDKFVQETPSQIRRHINANGSAAARASQPERETAIYSDSHSIITFIQMFHADLHVADEDIVLMKGDRDAASRWYQVDLELVKRARKMILYVVYSHMYYTTLKGCTLQRAIDSDEAEFARVQLIAAKFKLAMDANTRYVSDWGRDAYRPVVVVTFAIDYYVVRDVQESAAALHTRMTALTPASK